MKYEIDILYYLALYKKEWLRMILIVLLAGCIAAFLGYRQPLVYQSTVKILCLKEAGRVASMAKYFGLPELSVGTAADVTIFEILESRRMREDINKHFNLKDKPGFWWSLSHYYTTGGFAAEVRGPDPEMTMKIANFAIENLDNINEDLKITPNKPMAKVLDSAIRGTPIDRKISRKVVASGLFGFLFYTLFIFLKDYLHQAKEHKKR